MRIDTLPPAEIEELARAPMRPARMSYVREMLDNKLSPLGLSGKLIKAIGDTLLDRLNFYSFPLPEHFFDFPRSARIYANMESTSVVAAATSILINPGLLLEIHDVPTCAIDEEQEKLEKQDPRVGRTRYTGKEMPDTDLIARCAYAVKQEWGKLPSRNFAIGAFRHAGGLPEDGPSWTTILNNLPTGTTIGKIVQEYEAKIPVSESKNIKNFSCATGNKKSRKASTSQLANIIAPQPQV